MMDSERQMPIGALPEDYAERVYAGVLGKLIGVYLGRPFEGWTNERIERELGDITDYVHDRLGKRLLVTDDDISGTLTFVRAFEDYGDSFDIPARDIGQSWLNYIIENRLGPGGVASLWLARYAQRPSGSHTGKQHVAQRVGQWPDKHRFLVGPADSSDAEPGQRA